MCGDLVSNHGTTGRASIERAEARPSYPILSFAWNHVGAGVVLVQTNPTQPTGLTLLRLHLRVSTDRPPPPPPPAPSLSTSSFASSSSSAAYYSSSSSSSSFSTSFYYCYCYCYYYRCCCCCCCRRYSFATLGLPPTATYRRPLPPPTASRSLAFVLRPSKLLPSPTPHLLRSNAYTHVHLAFLSSSLMSSALPAAISNPSQSRKILMLFSVVRYESRIYIQCLK